MQTKLLYEEFPRRAGYQEEIPKGVIEILFREKCLMKGQKIGNCWWVSPKGGMFVNMIMDKIAAVYGTEKYKAMSEKDRKEELELIFDKVLALYKHFSEFTPITQFIEYLQRPDKGVESDHELVKLIAHKLHTKTWHSVFKGVKQPFDLPALFTIEQVENEIENYKKRYHLDNNFAAQIF